MRRFVHFATAFAVPFVLVAAVALGACDGADDAAAFGDTKAAGDNSSGQGDEPTTSFGKDAGEAVASPETKRGLCNLAPSSSCTPDHTGSEGDDGCVKALDAGAGLDATDLRGCHVVKDEKGELGPRCEAADARGVDGVSCAKSSDCAPGFDCVEGDKGPVCRRYCCSGSCEGQLSTNSSATFCDVRKLATPDPHLIPVCMPIKSCKLLHDGDCSDKETCAVVTEKGETSCVPKGDAKVCDSCDDTHCDSNLNCLGSPGDRHCYKLCRVDQSGDCAPMETCTTGAVFPDTTFGVCKAS